MTAFRFCCVGVKPAVMTVAMHGMTDFDSPARWVPAYALAAVPLPSEVVTVVFVFASLFHFATDLGSTGSLALHTAVAATTATMGTQAGLAAMGLYLLTVHTPLHYARCVSRRRYHALYVAAVSSAFALRLAPCLPRSISLTDCVQRVVIGHILTEAQV